MMLNEQSTVFVLVLAVICITGVPRCFEEVKRNRVFNFSPGEYDPNTLAPRVCITLCGSFAIKYAATGARFCFCGHNLPDSRLERPLNKCMTPCPGDAAMACGGKDYHVSVYESSKPIVSVKLWTNPVNALVVAGSEVRFHYIGKANVKLVYELDYGDGTGFSLPNATDIERHRYWLPGKYRSVVRTEDQYNWVMPKEAVWEVRVIDHVSDVTLKCQNGFATFQEGECQLVIYRGSGLKVTDTVDEQSRERNTLDPEVYYVGQDIPKEVRGAIPVLDKTEGTLFIFADAVFRLDGKVLGWEMHVERKGKIELAILKPNCRNYCSMKNKCTDKCYTECLGTAFGASAFCPFAKSCNTTCLRQDRHFGMGISSYVVRQTVHIDTMPTGRQRVETDSPIHVFSGDVLAWQYRTTGGILSIQQEEEETYDFMTNELRNSSIEPETVLDMAKAQQLERKRHLIRAVVIAPSKVRLTYTFKDTGNKVVSVNVSSRLGAEAKVVSEKILVVEGINEARIGTDRFVATGEHAKFIVLPHTGTSVKYDWDFGDGTIKNGTELSEISYNYITRGNYTVRLTSWNIRSSKTNTTHVIVQDRLTGLSVAVQTQPVIAGNSSVINMNLKAGSDYYCLWNFGDGTDIRQTQVESFVGSKDRSYTFKERGEYTINVTCINRVSVVTATTSLQSQEYISGLRLERTGADKNQPFKIVWLLTSGTNVKFNLQFNGGVLPVAKADLQNRRWETQTQKPLPLGVYDLKLTASNELNSAEIETKFTVLVSIKGVNVTTTRLRIPLYESVTFTLDMVRGSNVEVVWDYDDGENDMFSLGANDWEEHGPEMRTHKFTLAKRHNVTIIIENFAKRVVKRFVVVAIQKVDNVTMQAPVFAMFVPPGYANYTFTSWDPQKPNEATVDFRFGDPTENRNHTYPLEMNSPYRYAYRNRQSYNMMAEIWNDFSRKSFSHTVKVVEPVENMRIKTNPPSAIIDEPLEVKVIMYRGPSGADCSLTFDFGDGSPVRVIQRKGYGEDGEDIVKVTYNDLSTREISVTARTPVENVTVTYEVPVERKVFDMIKFKSNHPVKHGDPVEFYITYPNKPLPTNAFIVFNYGDGSPVSKNPFYFPEGPGGTKTYQYWPQSPGHWPIKIKIYNNASSVERTLEVGSYEPFDDLNFTASFTSALPVDGPALPGLEGKNLKFPRDRDLIVNMSMTKGTPLVFDMEGRGPGETVRCHDTSNPFKCSFNVPGATDGEYDIRVTAQNELFNGSIERKVIFLDSVYKLHLTDLTPKTQAEDVKTLEVSFNMTGTESCLYIDFDDGRTTAAYASSPNYCSMSRYNDAQFMGPLEEKFQVNYTYVESSFYEVTALAVNPISNDSSTVSFSVSQMDCSKPRVRIHKRSIYFYAPMVFRRGSTITLNAKTNISCAVTFDNTKHWEMEIIEPNWGIAVGKIDFEKLGIKTNMADIVIPPRTLKYGIYKAVYSVEMATKNNEGVRFPSSSFSFLKVIKSDLVGMIEKGGVSEITRSYGQVVVLNPGKYSYDPDLETGEEQTFTSFIWSCKDLLEPDGKCPNILPRFSSPNITFSTTLMKEIGKYELSVNIYKDSRNAEAKLILHIVPAPASGAIPSVTIECAGSTKCVQLPEGKLVSSTARLGLKCICADCNSTDTISYQWTGASYDYSWPWKPFIEETFQKYSRGLTGEKISVNSKIYALESDVERYRFGCKVTRKGDTSGGQSYLKVTLNTPPVPGTCTVAPKNGTVSWGHDSKFCVSCSKWTDDNLIVEYKFYTKQKLNDLEYHLTKAEDATRVCMDLPLGAVYDDYRQELWVKVRDNLDAMSAYKIDTVQVYPISTSEIREKTVRDIKDTNTRLDLLIAEGDQKTITEKLTELGSMLNFDQQQSQIEYSDVPNNDFSLYGPDGSSLFAEFGKTSTGNKSALLIKASIERDNRAKLRTKAVKGCASVSTTDVAAIEEVSTCLATNSMSASECSRECQLAVADKSLDMAQQLRDMDLSIEDLKSTSIGILSAISSVSTASAYNLKSALRSEYQMDQLSPEFFNFDTNLESKQQDYKTSDRGKAEFLHTMNVHEEIQIETAKKVAQQQEQVRKVIEEVWAQKSLPGETDILHAPSFTMSLSNIAVDDLPGMTFQADAEPTTTPQTDAVAPTVTFTGQTTEDMFTKNQTVSGDHVSISVISTKSDAGMFAPNSDQLGTTNSFLSVSVTNTVTGFPVVVDDTRDDFIIMIPRDENKKNLFFKNVQPVLAPMSDLFLHKARIFNKEASFHMEFDIVDPEAQFLVIVNFGKKPSIENNECDFVGLIPNSMKNREPNDPQQTMFFLNNHKVGDFTGDVYVGVRQLEKQYHDNEYRDCSELPSFNKSGALAAFRTNYSSRIFTSGCFFFDTPTQKWETNGLTVGPKTNSKVTECLSNHLTTFAGGWFVSPNTIDWDFVFSHADFYTNPTVYITEVVIAFIYILAVVLARRKDKKDVERLGLTPLKDNHPADKYYYEVIVFTGMRRNAGTDSKVFVIFSGEKDETDARMLADDKRKVFRRGAVDGFLLAVRQPLGPLNYARIWHDNSGKGKFASWFLKYVIVRDIQTDEKFVLIANRWFAVEEDDGQVDRVVPVAGNEQMTEFSHLFTERSRKSLVDGHIWFSVMARPPQSRFTCVQRVSCCLCLLFTSMLANAMFYGIPKNEDNQNTFVLGPFALTPTQIFIGVISNLIVFPVNFLIVTLFRKSRARTKRPSRIEAALKAAPTASVDDVKPEMGGIWHTNKPFVNTKADGPLSRPLSACSQKSDQSVDGQTKQRTTEAKRTTKKKKFELPWWCRIAAWVLLWLTTFAAAAFVTFYAIQFGDRKTKKWITSLLISFLTSVFVTQPAKVFLTAMFLSLVFRSPGEDDGEEPEDEEEPNLPEDGKLAVDEEYLHQPSTDYGPARPRQIGYQPPERAELERAREQRIKEIKMWDIIREIILYSFFLWILMVISYRQRSSNSFYYKNSLETLFINNKDMKMPFMKIRNTEEFWTWCQTDLVNAMRASNYYNNYPPLMLRGYLGDKVSRIMGYATLRQLRVKQGKCEPDDLVKDIITSCTASYTVFSEDTNDYNARWMPLDNTTNVNRREYTYSKSSKLNGYPYLGKLTVYGGGGYVVELRQSRWVLTRMMSKLQKEQWIDRHTRAVFVELTVYNPQVNLFAILTIIAELSDTGGVVPSYRIEPAMLLPYMSSALLFQIICEMVYFVFTIMFIFKEMKKFIQLKLQYFKCVWNLVEVSIIAMSIAAIVVYFYKFIVTNKLTSQFKENKGNKYMKFQYIGYWNEVFSYIIGWLVFFGTLKFLKLLRFNKRMSLLAATLKKGSKRLAHFSLIFWIVFLAFIQLFYLTYLSSALSFSSFVGSVETGVLMVMGQIDIFSMTMVLPVMSHVYVFLFVFTITFIVVNMFLSILNETFADVRAGLTKMSNDYEILTFMLNRFKMWTGLWDAPQAKKLRIRRRKSRAYCSKTALAIEEFPERIDRLLNSISNVYMEERMDVSKNAAMASQKMKLAKLIKPDEEPLFLDDISEQSKKD